MSPWDDQRRPTWPLYLGIGLVALAMLSGLLLMWGLPGSDEPGDRGPRSTPSPTPSSSPPDPTSPAGEEPTPEIVRWGRSGDQLSVVLRNASDRVVHRARVRITARDARGRALLATTGSARDVCCTVVGLAPGEEFGVFAILAPSVAEVAEVEVDYASVEHRAVRAREPRVRTTRGILERTARDTVVTATLRAEGPVHGYVAGQAFLTDHDGDLVAVISGRFYCFGDGTTRRVRMHLLRPVPAGTRIDRVLAHPVPAGVPPLVRASCS